MKILILTQNVQDIDGMKKGLVEAQILLSPIIPVTFDFKSTLRKLTSIPLNSDVVQNGYEVNPDDILSEERTGYNLTCLIYDWNFIFPHPTNPCTNYSKSLTDVPMQIPVNFYSNLTVTPIITYPEVLTEFFLHEFSHYIADEAGVTDLTHYKYQFSQFSQKSNIDYYLFLIKQNMTNTIIDTTLNAQNGPITRSTVRIGSKGLDVIYLQQKLGITSDGSFGPITQKSVEAFQASHGLIADGVVGPLTWAKINATNTGPSISDIITQVCIAHGVEPELGIAVATCESGLNQHSTLYNPSSKSTDRGIFQWNNVYHNEISDADAFDPIKATEWFCKYITENPKNLHGFWSASEHCWATQLSPAIKAKYGIS